jgi:GxxExxY protein
VDFLIEGQLILEIKSIDVLAPVHKRQVLAYLWQSKLHHALLINFNVPVLKEGIRRVIRS